MRNKLQCCWIPFYRIKQTRPRVIDKAYELWRLRINFIVMMVLSFVAGVGYTSILSSFHQFVTNPTGEDLQGTDLLHLIHHGLGKSEFFYSWTVTAYSIGEVAFAPLAGYATVCIPYWYILMIGIAFHIVGFVLYSLSTNGWMVLLSRVLSGAFAGIIETIAYSYISEKESDYEAAHAEVYKSKKPKPMRIKEYVYSYLTVAITISYLLGPGVSAVVSQIPQLSLFQSIGYFNVILGVISTVIVILFFHGEFKSKCCPIKKKQFIEKNREIQDKKWWRLFSLTGGACKKISILLFFLFASYIMDSSYAVVDTLFNPILSDNFGFTVRDISYYFIGVMVVYVVASLLLILFNILKFDTRKVILVAVVASICGSTLIADWQAIEYDSCRQYSVTHKDLIQENTTDSKEISHGAGIDQMHSSFVLPCTHLEMTREGLSFESRRKLQWEGNTTDLKNDDYPRIVCTHTKNLYPQCACSKYNDSSCIGFKITSAGSCFEFSMANSVSMENISYSAMHCDISGSSISLNINVINANTFTELEVDSFKESVLFVTKFMMSLSSFENITSDAHIQGDTSIILNDYSEDYDYGSTAVQFLLTRSEICMNHSGCHWNQFSSITKTDCFSCPPICHSVKQSLNFVQFSLGVTIFVLAIPISRVALMVLISNNLNKNEQGPFTGIIVATGGIARTVTPIWIDAAYEVAGKRTFIAMIIKIVSYIPVLLGLLLLYRALIPQQPEERNTPSEGSSDSEHESNSEHESKQLLESSVK